MDDAPITSAAGCGSPGAPVPDEPRKSFRPSGNVIFLPLAFNDL